MKQSRAVLLTFMCVSGVCFSRISGEPEVEMRVRPGDDVTLYCDCVMPAGLYIAWFRSCSHQHQPPLLITYSEIFKSKFPRFSFVQNLSSGSYDLLVKNISENDLGLYYCAVHERKVSKDGKGAVSTGTVYHYGKLTTRLSLRDTVSPCLMASTIPTSTPPVSDCSVCWKLLVSVCPVCVLLSSLLSSTCVYFICRSRNKANTVTDQPGGVKVGEDEVCYASLDLPSRGQKRLKKKKRIESLDFSTYSEVKTNNF